MEDGEGEPDEGGGGEGEDVKGEGQGGEERKRALDDKVGLIAQRSE